MDNFIWTIPANVFHTILISVGVFLVCSIVLLLKKYVHAANVLSCINVVLSLWLSIYFFSMTSNLKANKLDYGIPKLVTWISLLFLVVSVVSLVIGLSKTPFFKERIE